MSTPIANRNYLSPSGFNFIINKVRGVDFFCQTASIPSVSMNSATQATNLRNVSVPGDELSYGDLTVSFMVDEDMTNYISLHTWIRKLGFPVNREEFDFEAPNTLSRSVYTEESTLSNRLVEQNTIDYNFEYSDATLQILNSNYNIVRTIKFYDCFPVSLSTLEFRADVTDTQYLTAQANFKYLYFDIV